MSILAIAAHPDDEALGCAATLARHARLGETVRILFVADGVAARPDAGAAARPAREAMAEAAARALGAEPPVFLRLPDNRLDSLPLLDLTQAIEAATRDWAPRVIYTHAAGDMNLDHRRVHQAVRTAFRPLPGSPVEQVLGFEVASSSEWGGPGFGPAFQPTLAVAAEATEVAAKWAALDAYAAEMRPAPHPRSRPAIEALMRWRGASFGLEMAETFEVIRQVVR
ncbi:PIG-L deacetylase family protein [Roseospirillum parvum]|uniref:N-acetylglucosaminyl deacetylase, LmbE family n=1 Tax=Roseospirillum parvum TaxID=83401 RepID=A0A1G8A221_9PROT|nr:PIG-L family deacetylase [Roseospirillum parvum]SDH14979.1 N-acetylglucosaminyl deacetylase, LmbE family [Roseospirillum parvum]